ncbi:hypothetical protein LMG33818_000848 [Halomonadaceae bacterium LMG 33818]|uniref:HdeD family acid-resistance protein n=1 Tax=Cernens ardua TaxID=3402176 RepID=UPI003EDC7B52
MSNPIGTPSSWKWTLGIGIIMLIIGIIAMGNLVATTAVSIYIVGIFMLVAGVLQIIHGFQQHSHRVFWIVAGLLYAIAGILALSNPLVFSSVLTLWLGIMLIFSGISRLFSLGAVHNNRGWVIVSSIITALLGIMLVAGWPVTGLWVIGMFLAFDLLFQGISFILLGLSLKSRF